MSGGVVSVSPTTCEREVVFIPFSQTKDARLQEVHRSALLLTPEIAKGGGNLVLGHERQREGLSVEAAG